jgi:hypothetical protein
VKKKFIIGNPELTGDENIKVHAVKEIQHSENLISTFHEISAESVSDGYHTMHQLYQHRMALNAFLFKMMYKLDLQVRKEEANDNPLIMKSKLHHDGTMFDGYFVVVAFTNVGQISYHYKLKHWDIFQIPEIDKVPWPFDGHGSKEIIERLLKL